MASAAQPPTACRTGANWSELDGYHADTVLALASRDPAHEPLNTGTVSSTEPYRGWHSRSLIDASTHEGTLRDKISDETNWIARLSMSNALDRYNSQASISYKLTHSILGNLKLDYIVGGRSLSFSGRKFKGSRFSLARTTRSASISTPTACLAPSQLAAKIARPIPRRDRQHVVGTKSYPPQHPAQHGVGARHILDPPVEIALAAHVGTPTRCANSEPAIYEFVVRV